MEREYNNERETFYGSKVESELSGLYCFKNPKVTIVQDDLDGGLVRVVLITPDSAWHD